MKNQTKEKKAYQAVIFDLDGTLLNTLEDLKDSVNYALRMYHKKERSLEEVRNFVGNGVEKLVQRALMPDQDEKTFTEVFAVFKAYYEEHCNDKTCLYPGIAELLTSLQKKGIKTAIVSNKMQEGVDVLYHLYFEKYLKVAIGASEGIRKKPAPDTAREALRLLQVSAKDALYVGDSDVDIATARNAGMDCVSVTWGFRTVEELQAAGAAAMINRPEELLSLIETSGKETEMEREMETAAPVKWLSKFQENREITVSVPGSKSITNRALLLAALSQGTCHLKGVLFSDDSRGFLDCLIKLGFNIEINEKKKEIIIEGTGGRIPDRKASINVRSAGTAARFLTVMLAMAGGDYELTASPQMCKRPMEPLLSLLEACGVTFEFHGEEGHFPFALRSGGIHQKEVRIDTKISSQFASALLMCAAMKEDGLTVILEGDRSEGAYIKMTLAMMRQFGIEVEREGRKCIVSGNASFGVPVYEIEPDVSGACYFYAMAPLLKTSVIVNGVHENSIQGDIAFLSVLSKIGCKMEDTEKGICVDGRLLSAYPGQTLSMKDFSDQTMTMAAIAPFAASETRICDIEHIRYQESDRMKAIITELNRMGVSCEEIPEEKGILIRPVSEDGIRETEVETYEDHRMAMAFSLIGLKTGKIGIRNPGCCRKTFENYFELIEELQENNHAGSAEQ